MGSRVVGRVAEAGHAVTVWNRDRDRAIAAGAGRATIQVADDLTTLATASDVIVATVRDDDAAREVWSRVLPVLAPGTTCIDMSTISVRQSADFVDAVAAAAGAGAVAPMIGSLPQAESGSLVLLVGGGEAATRTAHALLSPAGEVREVPSAAVAAQLKLAVNAMLAMQAAALQAIWPLAFTPNDSQAAGDQPWEQIIGLPVFSDAARGLAARMRAENSPSLFPIDLVAKDLGYAVDGLGGADPVLAATRDTFEAAAARGRGAEDISRISTRT
jgi:3-hydroxyisobutyrate dehydrogenase-like beta-hydroxyacid dehydrogenase